MPTYSLKMNVETKSKPFWCTVMTEILWLVGRIRHQEIASRLRIFYDNFILLEMSLKWIKQMHHWICALLKLWCGMWCNRMTNADIHNCHLLSMLLTVWLNTMLISVYNSTAQYISRTHRVKTNPDTKNSCVFIFSCNSRQSRTQSSRNTFFARCILSFFKWYTYILWQTLCNTSTIGLDSSTRHFVQ